MNDSTEHRRVRVAVVFGGRSSEHEVSCVTAGCVLAALDPTRYEVIPIGITKAGQWVLMPDDPEQLAIVDGVLPSVPDEVHAPVTLSTGGTVSVLRPGPPVRVPGEIDVVFPLLHGPFGEDGTLQGLLELADVRYVGSGVLSSAVGMDKPVMKQLLAAAGLPVARSVLVRSSAWEPQRARVLTEVAALGMPVFVKPARAGSSMGVTKVRRPDDLEAAVLAAREHDPKVLIEEAVFGREIECAVLQGRTGDSPEASVVGEIRVDDTHEYYDFQAKYLPAGDVHLDIPADVPPGVAERVREMSVAAFEALCCESLARVDFFLRPDGSVVVNEVNTMPGFTPTSMFPMLWEKSGLDYRSLLDRLIEMAARRPRGLR